MGHILLQHTEVDRPYLPYLKPIVGGRCTLHLSSRTPTAILEVAATAKQKGCTQVATTSSRLLSMLLNRPADAEKLPSLDDYAGSIIEKYGIEFLILNPVEHIVTTNFGRFLYERHFKKFLQPDEWLTIPTFSWELFEPRNTDNIIGWMCDCDFISVDIETARNEERAITCIGFTGVRIDSRAKSFTSRTVVIPFSDLYSIQVVRKICGLSVLKVFQNGKYDNAYLLRYGIITINWAGDTAHLFHSWYSELPKRLDFIVSFLLRKWQYWKDESKTSDLMEYYQYNAKDAFTTAMAWLAITQEAPQWAWDNYVRHEFPLVFPCMLAENTGLKASEALMAAEEVRFNASLELQLASLRRMVGNALFNPSSSYQVLRLFQMLGSGDILNTKPAARDKVAYRHPFNKRLMAAIEKYRKDRKIVTSYLRNYDPKEKKYKLWNGRMFYSINPHGTDTARLAGQSSHFWCGTNIHNQPRDRPDIQVKNIYLSDNGFLFGEADYEQAEARDTAYLSGDTDLIAAVDDVTKDFHGRNAAAFFGVLYERIVNSYTKDPIHWIHKVIDKALRDLSKRVNHGSNYNMGAAVMLDTMGIENVLRAKALLGLSARLSLLQVTQHLLNVYAETYKVVKGEWYAKVKSDVRNTNFLISPLGWHRYCFGHPDSNKRDLNAYVAHPPQNLNAGTLNLAYRKVFYEVWLPNRGDFKLGPQIHDSILFQYREGREDLAWKVKDCMEFKVPVKDTFGITRDLLVPVALKGGATRWSDIKELERV